MALQLQLRRDTSSNWTSVNPTLAQGELGFEIDTGKLKIGDGSSDWVTLPYRFTVLTDHTQLTSIGTNTHAQIDSHISNTSNPHATTAAQVGADPSGTASSLVTTHEAASDPHPQYTTASELASALGSYQPLDGDLTAVAGLAGAGFAVRTTTNTWATRSLTTPVGSGLAITNQDGVFGSPAFTNTDKGSTAVATHEGLSDPHPQYETSAEAQAKVDAHATLTNNPHAVTKAQVGLGNVDNTSDLNKPINTATQTALNLKYDASNPNGYETPSQLNTRDTNNRNRGNHTGTQLAATISDFATAVLGTVLTGISFATATAVLATDTILQAIGKLQAQLNARVFGTEYQDFEDAVASTTTSGAQPLTAVASSFTTNNVPTGRYRIGMQYYWTNNSTLSDSRFQVFVDGVAQANQHNEELQDNSSQKHDQIIFNINLTAGTHTIELRFGSEGGITTTVNKVICEFWRVS